MSPQLNLGASNSSRIKLYMSLDFQSLNLTTGKYAFTVCLLVCRVQHFEHTANTLFAVCLSKNTWQTNTWQTIWHTSEILHTANKKAHGKHTFSGSDFTISICRSLQIKMVGVVEKKLLPDNQQNHKLELMIHATMSPKQQQQHEDIHGISNTMG